MKESYGLTSTVDHKSRRVEHPHGTSVNDVPLMIHLDQIGRSNE